VAAMQLPPMHYCDQNVRPGGRIVLIMTRWHEDDLARRIPAEMTAGGERWQVLSLPAESRAWRPARPPARRVDVGR
jgi:hypothetical protein